ncbi:hypothetical protein [Rickettsia endosymbiont of Cardiosporidium cionae]|uniref:hypothetical protein n=1 Tax=Rickettsia endosymbiont of Cardiosporidium cionae TaxID=2777155 RepID=UPI0018934F68|nr:hypothetical protein [Rickettsia endosymbiont of Cardiosporidium cionae]
MQTRLLLLTNLSTLAIVNFRCCVCCKRLFVRILFLCSILGSVNIAFAVNSIDYIFISAEGTNAIEAKIRAHDLGKRRALSLILNQKSIQNIANVAYSDLQHLFNITVHQESSTMYKYTATVTYYYEKNKLNDLIFKYATGELLDKFYEYLIINVDKQGTILTLLDNSKNFNVWKKFDSVLKYNKIYLAQGHFESLADLVKDSSKKNIMELRYQDFINIFGDVFFKNVLIITTELFTNKSGVSYLEVKQYIFSHNSPDKVKTLAKNYTISNISAIPNVIELIIKGLINNYGKPDTLNQKNTIANNSIQNQNETKVDDLLTINNINMYLEVYSQEKLNLIKDKLSKITIIKSYKLLPQTSNLYNIIINTEATEWELMEEFYLHNLSYTTLDNKQYLINLESGI